MTISPHYRIGFGVYPVQRKGDCSVDENEVEQAVRTLTLLSEGKCPFCGEPYNDDLHRGSLSPPPCQF